MKRYYYPLEPMKMDHSRGVCVCVHVCVCVCIMVLGGSTRTPERFLLLLQHREILINLIPLCDQRTVLLAENMTALYGCNKKITAMSTGPENEAS